MMVHYVGIELNLGYTVQVRIMNQIFCSVNPLTGNITVMELKFGTFILFILLKDVFFMIIKVDNRALKDLRQTINILFWLCKL